MVTADHPFPGFFLSSFSILLIYPFIAREGETIRFFFRIISVFAIVRFRSRHEIVGGFFGKIKNERTNCFSFDIFFFFRFRETTTSYELRATSCYRISEYEYDHYPNPVYVFASFHNQIKPGLIAGSLALYQNCWPIHVYRGNE